MSGPVNNNSRANTPPSIPQQPQTTNTQPQPPAPTVLNTATLPNGGPQPRRQGSAASLPTGGNRRTSALPNRPASARAASVSSQSISGAADSSDEDLSDDDIPDSNGRHLGSSVPATPRQPMSGTPAMRARSETAASNTSIASNLALSGQANLPPAAYLHLPSSSRASVASSLLTIPETNAAPLGSSLPTTSHMRAGGAGHTRARSETAASSTSLSSEPPELPPQVSKLAHYIHMAVESQISREAAGSTPGSSPALSGVATPTRTSAPPPVPSAQPAITNPTPQQIAEADANIDEGLEQASRIMEFLGSLSQQASPAPSTPSLRPQSRAASNVPSPSQSSVELSDSDEEGERIHLETRGNRPLSIRTASPDAPAETAETAEASESSESSESELEADTQVAAPATAAAQRSAGAVWLRNSLDVAGGEAVAVGLSTGIREVVDGLVRTAQNNSHGSEEAQKALAVAIITLIGLGNVATMVSRRGRGTNTMTADAGNVLQILGLTASALSAADKGQLKDLLPGLTKTVVYAGMRDATNTFRPYADNPNAGNPLAAQAWNTGPYTVNQLAVNWLQSSQGISGAGIADKLHGITTTNATEAAAQRSQVIKGSVAPALAYVGANTAGEVFDKIVGSILEQAVGEQGWAGVSHMAISHEPLRLPSGSDWGDMMEKTVSRMSLFGTVLGTSAATGAAVSPVRFGETGATALDNFAGAASVAVMCLPFVATLMKKARASAATGAVGTGGGGGGVGGV